MVVIQGRRGDGKYEDLITDDEGRLQVFDPAVAPAVGITSDDGNVGGTTVVDTTRTEPNDHWNGMALLITSGAQSGQLKEIVTWVLATGTFTVAGAFGGQILEDVTYKVLAHLPADVDILEIEAKLGEIVDAEAEAGAVLPRLLWLKNAIRRGTGTALGANKSLVDAIGFDGIHPTNYDFSLGSLGQWLHGFHHVQQILFVIPETIVGISADNTAMLAVLDKLGEVITITQADALNYPDFYGVSLCVLGSNSDTAWNTANLANLKTVPNLPIICVDKVAAAYLELGTAQTDSGAVTDITAIANIEGTILGTGYRGTTGLAVGANTISAATIMHRLNMSEIDITEIWYAYESVNANTHVVIGMIPRIQASGEAGVDEEGEEVEATMAFFGCGYLFSKLNTLGEGVFELLCEKLIHEQTVGRSISIAADIRLLEKRLLGNMKTRHSNASPLAAFISGNTGGLGTELPNSASLYDILAGANGIPTYPAAAVPGDGVSIAQVLRQVYESVKTLSRPQNGTQATTAALAVVGVAIEHATIPFITEGYLSLHNMQAGDTFLVTEEVRDQDNVTYREYGRNSYFDVQTSPMVHFSPKRCQGWRVRIQRTAGTDRDITYQFFIDQGGA